MTTKTFTHASATDSERVYIDKKGNTRVITQNQTFTMNMVDDGTTARYFGLTGSSEMTFEDGGRMNLEGDFFSYMNVTADATAVVSPGSLWVVEDDFSRHELVIRTVTIDDADSPSTATFVLERRDNPMITWTWTGITVA